MGIMLWSVRAVRWVLGRGLRVKLLGRLGMGR
jgi:hypothetical protein